MRIPNIIGPLCKSNTFIGWFYNCIKTNSLYITNNIKSYKDFITLEYLTESIYQLCNINFTGTINVSSGEKIYLYELFGNMKYYYENLIDDSFILDSTKIQSLYQHENKQSILDYWYKITKSYFKY